MAQGPDSVIEFEVTPFAQDARCAPLLKPGAAPEAWPGLHDATLWLRSADQIAVCPPTYRKLEPSRAIPRYLIGVYR